MAEILLALPAEVTRPALNYPAFRPVLQSAIATAPNPDPALTSVIERLLESAPA